MADEKKLLEASVARLRRVRRAAEEEGEEIAEERAREEAEREA